MDAGAVAVGVGQEVFPKGFTIESARKAAHRIRDAMDAWRALGEVEPGASNGDPC